MSVNTFAREVRLAKSFWGDVSKPAQRALRNLLDEHKVSIAAGEVKYLNGTWYVTHSGLLRIAHSSGCAGIQVRPLLDSSDPANFRWVFEATVFKSARCRGFVGYGDADPSNVSPLVRGAEMRVAETRAVNRALRKAYGIGVCSIEELGDQDRGEPVPDGTGKRPPQSTLKNRSSNETGNGNGGPRVRDRLCQLIRHHGLDSESVKAYALEFCGTSSLKDASRSKVEQFVQHLAERVEHDREALLCQLSGYPKHQAKEGAEAGAA